MFRLFPVAKTYLPSGENETEGAFKPGKATSCNFSFSLSSNIKKRAEESPELEIKAIGEFGWNCEETIGF